MPKFTQMTASELNAAIADLEGKNTARAARHLTRAKNALATLSSSTAIPADHGLTDKEVAMLVAFVKGGIETNGSTTAEELIADNMTWMSATDLVEVLGQSKQSVGGVMASLEAKGLIVNSQESARGARDTDWFASEEGITLGWSML